MDFLTNIEPWHWLVAGFLLLGLEALGAGGFLLGSFMAAVLLSVLLWLVPGLEWGTQLLVFGTASLILTLAYWKFFRKVNEQSDYPELNNRMSLLVGRVIELPDNFSAGQGRIQIGDTLWKAHSAQAFPAGQTVKVVGYSGSVLDIEPVD